MAAALSVGLPGLVRADAVHVEAVVQPAEGIVEGTLRWTFTNAAEVSLTELRLFAYPEHYRDDPDLADILLERVYSSTFDAGGQSVHEVTITRDGSTSAVTPQPSDATITLPLSAPLAPGDTVAVDLVFTTTVPRKYGGFGRFRRTLSMNGGMAPLPMMVAPDGRWLDEAPPARVAREVSLTMPADWSGVVGGVVLAPRDGARPLRTVLSSGAPAGIVPPAVTRFAAVDLREDENSRTLVVRSEASRWTTVVLHRGRASVVHHLPMNEDRTATFVGKELRRLQRRWVRWAAAYADDVLVGKGVPRPRGVVIVEAPLRRKLVELGDGVILVSDRFLEAELPVWRFMDVHLARAVLAEGLDDFVESREDPRFAPLTLDGVSWALAPEYLERRWKQALDLRRLLEQFDFIPQVDDLLQTPVYPFADQIFDNPYVVDPLSADVRRFNRPLRPGRVLFLRLEDHLDPERLDAAVDAWIEGDGGFFESLEGVDARAIAEAWLGPIPRSNLTLDPLQRGRTEDGRHTTTVTLRREQLEGERTEHPTEVQLRMGPGKKQTLVWDGKDDVKTWTVETDRRVAAALLDPRGRVLEIDRDGLAIKYDNRRPRTVDVTAWGYLLAAAVTGADLIARAGVNIRPERDLRHRLAFEAFRTERVLGGGGASYTRYFGKPRLGAYRRHRVVTGFEVSWLDRSQLATDAPLLAEVRATYRYDDRRWSFKPTKGGFVEASVFAGKDFAIEGEGGRSLADSGYLGFDASGSYLFRLHPWHLIGVRGRFGAVVGSVAHRRFSLGGRGNVRGLPVDHVIGSVRTMATVEWRHTFIRDLDVHIPWLFSRLRGVRGALYFEAGVVSDSVRDLPKPEQGAYAIGYALRFFVDWFGFLPGQFGIDVAWTPGGPSGLWPTTVRTEDWLEVPFQVYLVGTQSF